MMKAIVPAAILSLLAITSANAAAPQTLGPQSSPVLAQDVSSLLTQVQYRGRDRHDHDRDGRRHRRYKPGSRHYRAPKHWRRHKSRPHDWRRRGCIIVGPVWFCP